MPDKVGKERVTAEQRKVNAESCENVGDDKTKKARGSIAGPEKVANKSEKVSKRNLVPSQDRSPSSKKRSPSSWEKS